VIHEILNNDNEPDTFTKVAIFRQSRRLNFVYPDINSRWFADFPPALIKEMASEGLSYHAHHNTISTDLYNRNEKLREFMKITATDTFVDHNRKITTFVMAAEAYDYPIYTVMHHPESTTLSVFDLSPSDSWKINKGRLPNDPRADAIMWHTSLFMKKEALKSGNRFASKDKAYESTVFE